MNGKLIRGTLYGVLAAAFYGLNPLFTLPLYKAGLSSDSVLMYRYGFGVLFLGLLMLVKKESFRISRHEILPLVLVGIIFAFSSLTLYQSYLYMDAGIASTILFVYPLLVALIMAVFFGERLTPTTLVALVLALSGIGLLYRPQGGGTLSGMGVLLVLASSLSYAVYIVAVARSELHTLSAMRLTFYALVFGSLIYLIRLRFGMDLQPIPSLSLWICPIGLALFPTVISLLAMTVSIHYIGSTPAAILGALEPITALAVGVVIFGESLTLRIVCGVLLILAGVILVVAGGNLMDRISYLLHRVRFHHRIS